MSDIEFRNVAIVAHVDHGKTTSVNATLERSDVFSGHEKVADRVMDFGDFEKEEDITILVKNTIIHQKGKGKNGEGLIINVIDTPGHADLGGEMERTLPMVDGAMLPIDPSEGSLLQAHFVLGKAFAACMPVVIVINKTDHPDTRIDEVVEEAQGLLLELASTLEDPEAAEVAKCSLELSVLYVSGRAGKASTENPGDGSLLKSKDLQPLPDVTIEMFLEPSAEIDALLQVQVTSLGSSFFLGRVGLVRIHKRRTRKGQQISWIYYDSEGNEYVKNAEVAELPRIVDMTRAPAQETIAGSIAAISGIDGAMIGDSLCDIEHPDPLPRIPADEPVTSMTIGVSTSPLAGQGGDDKLVACMIKVCLGQELIGNVSLHVLPTECPDVWEMQGRDEMALPVLVETMRREGFELTTGRPQVVTKTADGKVQRPYEHLTIDVPEEYLGAITQLMVFHKGRMEYMGNQGTGWVCMEFLIPSRGLIDFRTTFTTKTRGTGITNHYSAGHGKQADEIKGRSTGSLIVDRTGQIIVYVLTQLSDHGAFFVKLGDQTYKGMVVDQDSRDEDVDISITKEKKLANMHAISIGATVTPEKVYEPSLDEAMEFCGADECVEVIPEGIYVRKQIPSVADRARVRSRAKAMNRK